MPLLATILMLLPGLGALAQSTPPPCAAPQQQDNLTFAFFDASRQAVRVTDGNAVAEYRYTNATKFLRANGDFTNLEYFRPGMPVGIAFCPSDPNLDQPTAPLLVSMRERPAGSVAAVEGIVVANNTRVGDFSYGELLITTASGEAVNVAINAVTIIRNAAGQEVEPAAVAVGSRIAATGEWTPTLVPPTRLEARYVAVLGQSQTMRAEGIVGAVEPDAGTFRIDRRNAGPVRVATTSATRYERIGGGEASLADVVVGRAVVAEGTTLPLGAPIDGMTATLVKIGAMTSPTITPSSPPTPSPTPPPTPQLVEFRAPIQAIFASENAFAAAFYHVLTNGNTSFRSEISDAPIGLADLAVGDVVRVRAYPSPVFVPAEGFDTSATGDGAAILPPITLVTALEVVLVERPTPEPVFFNGQITEVNGELRSLVLDGETLIRTTSETIVRNDEGPVPFETLEPGWNVEGTGVRLNDGSIRADMVVMLHRNPPPLPVLFVGPVVQINREDGFINVGQEDTTIAPIRVWINAGTSFSTESGEVKTFADLRVGMRVQVAALPTSGRMTAISVVILANVEPTPTATPTATATPRPSPTPWNNQVTFVAPIESINTAAMRFMAGGYDVLVVEATELVGPNGQRIPFSALTVGAVVEVRGEQSLLTIWPPQLIAARVKLRENVATPTPSATPSPTPIGTPEVRVIEGFVTEIQRQSTGTQPARIRVNEVLMNIAADVLVEDQNGLEIPLTAIQVGNRVRVEAVHANNTSASALLVARRITRLQHTVPVALEGIIESLNDELKQFVIRGTLVRVTNATEIVNREGEPATFDDIATGMFAEVEGTLGATTAGPDATTAAQIANVVTATRVRLHDDPVQEEQPVEFTGMISVIELNHALLIVSGRVVLVGEETEILGLDDAPITLTDLRVGLRVKVVGVAKGVAGSEGPALVEASLVAVEGEGCIEREVAGALTQKEGAEWRIGNKPVRITTSTVFTDREGNPLTVAAFGLRDQVVATGCSAPGAALIARTVVKVSGGVEPPACVITQVIDGLVQSVAPTSGTLVVRERLVLVTSSTEIIRDGVGRITLADVVAGDRAIVHGRGANNAAAPAGSLVACRIIVRGEVLPPPPVEGRVLGRIDSIDTPTMTLVVRNMTVQVSSTTRIESRAGRPISFGDLRRGLMIDARGRMEADNILMAGFIRVQEENVDPEPPRAILGDITALDLPTAIVVNDTRVVLTSGTIVTGMVPQPTATGAVIPVESLQVGDRVRVVLDREAIVPAVYPPILVAKRIELRGTQIQAIDAAERIITLSVGPVRVPEGAIIRDADDNATSRTLSFADLRPGDLVRVEIRRELDVYPPQARLVVRLATATFSGDVPGFSPTVPDTSSPAPGIVSNDPDNTFGFITLPETMTDVQANTMYELRMRISTNVRDPRRVPVLRLRLNMVGLEKAATMEIYALGEGNHVPNEGGRWYRALFVPPVVSNVGEPTGQLFASMDLIAVGGTSQARARLRLEEVTVNAIALADLAVAAELVRHNFADGTNGWSFGSAPEFYDPARFGHEPGALNLAASSRACLGWWDVDTGAVLTPGRLYRGRFVVRTNSPSATALPPFRLRLNTSNFSAAATVQIQTPVTLTEGPDALARVYDVYLPVPAELEQGLTMRAAFDILGFTEELNQDGVISLEEFLLEEMVWTE